MSPKEGERLKAFVVPVHNAAEHTDVQRRIEEYCVEEFSSHERPAHITIGDALPTSPLGKIKDWAIIVE